jgi:hypothetical protein
MTPSLAFFNNAETETERTEPRMPSSITFTRKHYFENPSCHFVNNRDRTSRAGGERSIAMRPDELDRLLVGPPD